MLDHLVSLQPVLFDKMRNPTKALIKKMSGEKLVQNSLSVTTMVVVGVESSFYRCNLTKITSLLLLAWLLLLLCAYLCAYVKRQTVHM